MDDVRTAWEGWPLIERAFDVQARQRRRRMVVLLAVLTAVAVVLIVRDLSNGVQPVGDGPPYAGEGMIFVGYFLAPFAFPCAFGAAAAYRRWVDTVVDRRPFGFEASLDDAPTDDVARQIRAAAAVLAVRSADMQRRMRFWCGATYLFGGTALALFVGGAALVLAV